MAKRLSHSAVTNTLGAGAVGFGCLYILAVLGFWGLVIYALLKYTGIVG